MLNIVYAKQPLRKSIFLAGPTPRSSIATSWRPEAVKILLDLKFDGDVFFPEPEPESIDRWTDATYDAQLYWEWEALNQSTVVVFWIPRDLALMPAFTTNVEFGLMCHSSKVLLGSPENAPKMRYLASLATRYGIKTFSNLNVLLSEAVSMSSNPFRLENTGI